MNQLLAAVGKPAAICILLGIVQFVQDYQASQKAIPALVDAVGVAAKTAAVWLIGNGAISGYQKAIAPKVPPSPPVG